MANKRVLLVDDEEEFTQTLSERMELRAIDVVVAKSGPEALEKIKDSTFDAVVLDMVMPEMDGIETLGRMREIDCDLQIIVLTGHAKLEQGIEAMKLGALDFLEKPVDINTLVNKVTEAWSKKQDLDQEKMDQTISSILKKKGW